MQKAKHMNKMAVSPVIAVILMVAITVVLASILYVWVMNLAETGEGAVKFPTVTIQLKKGYDDKTYLMIEHESGNPIKWTEYQMIVQDHGNQSNRITMTQLTGLQNFGELWTFTDNTTYAGGIVRSDLTNMTLEIGNEYEVKIYNIRQQALVLQKNIRCTAI